MTQQTLDDLRSQLRKLYFDRSLTDVEVNMSGYAKESCLEYVNYYRAGQGVLPENELVNSSSSIVRSFELTGRVFKPFDEDYDELLLDFTFELGQLFLPGFHRDEGGGFELEWEIFNDIIKIQGGYNEVIHHRDTEGVY